MEPRTPKPPEAAQPPNGRGPSRKTVLKAAVAAAPAALFLGAAAPALAREQAVRSKPLAPTPACDDGDDPTPPQMEGPYFKPDSPERTDLVEPGSPGTPLTLSGYVFGVGCEPLGNILLDFWQADPGGEYDNVGYGFRGHQYTAENGAFELSTLVPGLYPGRTRHLHVKVQAPGEEILTTQLYFPGEPRNETDPLYDPALLMSVRQDGEGQVAAFDFVLAVPGA